ncbi:50S ribosomal protein L16 [Porphyridium purpureum]|uniref:50S ribosomal protein L16 n=1 Tax=Porphyridium purpureum TaxID=35688 RepID=A0A5J4Z0P7_PORPP|nr:50S ribosomal protein L16 [Porphyridium purpureum]|eukprot:POR5996..scf209_3
MSLLRPIRMRWQKPHRNFEYPVDNKKHVLQFGQYGLKVIGNYDVRVKQIRFSAKQIDTHERMIKRELRVHPLSKGIVHFWWRIYPDRPVVKLGAEQRMGKGKAEVDHFSAAPRRGQILIEFSEAPRKIIQDVAEKFQKICHLRLKLVTKPRPTFFTKPLAPDVVERLSRKSPAVPGIGLQQIYDD